MKKISLLVVFIAIMIAGCQGSLNENEELHDYSVEVEGIHMKQMSIQQVADLWEISSEELFSKIIKEFNLEGNYTIETSLDEMRVEYKFSPAMVKE